MEQKENKKKKSSIVNWLLLIVFLIIVVVVIDSASDAEPVVVSNQTETISRCLSVPDWIVTRLNDGLNINGGAITDLQAVRSNDFGSVYFITGRLQGPGLGRETDLATFISNKLDNSGTGMTLSADSVAVEFSDWPDIAATNLLGDGGVSRGVVISSDGYKESRECVSSS
jgi:hypothetical protein